MTYKYCNPALLLVVVVIMLLLLHLHHQVQGISVVLLRCRTMLYFAALYSC